MHNPAGFSGQNLNLADIAYHHIDTKNALIAYFSGESITADPTLVGYTPSEVLDIRLGEHDYSSSMTILAAIEAALRVDYLKRQKRKDNLSKEFRALYKLKEHRVSLEEDILEKWRLHGGVDAKLIGELKSAFKYRQWLAHGRYWTPKLGRNYDYFSIYTLADAVLSAFALTL